MQLRNTHILTHSLISHLSPVLLRPLLPLLLLLLRRKFSCLFVHSAKAKKTKKTAKTAQKKSQKIPKNSQKFSKSLSVTLPIFPKYSFQNKNSFSLQFPPHPCSSSSFLPRRRRRRLHVPFLPCSDVCLFSCFVFLGDNIVPSSHKSG